MAPGTPVEVVDWGDVRQGARVLIDGAWAEAVDVEAYRPGEHRAVCLFSPGRGRRPVRYVRPADYLVAVEAEAA